jgi:photosystem II stability/assembly factor-like uncharacterized protein
MRIRTINVYCVLIMVFPLLPGCTDNPVRPEACTEEIDGMCWTFLGLDGKWVTALADTPWGLYAGTHDNGVFRYDPNTGDWEFLGIDHAIVSSILFVPTDTPRLLVGVYPFSDETTEAAVFASEDGGERWIPWDGGRAKWEDDRAWAYSMAVDPTNPYRLFMGEDYSVLRSEDGGRSWEYVWGDSRGGGAGVNALAVSPTGDGQVWAGGEASIFYAIVFRSEDGGNSWEVISPNPREEERVYEENAIHSLVVDPHDSNQLFAGMKFGYVIRSTDGGRTWHQVFQTPGKGFVWNMKYIDGELFATAEENFRPPDSGQGHPLTDLGLYRTRDGGETWDVIPVPPGIAGGNSLSGHAGGAVLVGTRGTGVWRLDP